MAITIEPPPPEGFGQYQRREVTKEVITAKPVGTNSEKGKELEAAGSKEGGKQSLNPRKGTSKGTEWVIKKTKAGRSHPSRHEYRDKVGSIMVGKTLEAKTAKKINPLKVISETEETQAQAQPDLEAEDRVDPEVEDRANLEAENQVEPETEAEDQIQAKGPSTVRDIKKSTGTITEQPLKKQVGKAIYFQQAIQIASVELRNKLKQAPKDLKGRSAATAAPKKVPNQINLGILEGGKGHPRDYREDRAGYALPGHLKLSDHSPCTISFFDEEDRGATPFKFFNMWAKHDNFLEIVGNTWRMHLRGIAMYKFYRKLKAVKVPLKDLNKQYFSHIAARAEAGEEDLIRAQQQLHSSPKNHDL
ncbi:hypothetical protein Acr_00g0041700 [Actinidia rufa]|uniref:Uncharacterized protein n=1 Tax=Actinidia rufa TaxID=165716 RepID=A0A7J0DI63_9ERIC|nr:hypothetical protein Acr_00g0041700 [Actinidia rufa]